jgi:hypothetical protein
MKKKLFTLSLSLLMLAALAPAPAGAADGLAPAANSPIVTLQNDGVAITNAAFNQYFNASALDSVKALLAAGKVYVNGIRVPVTENDTVSYEVNRVPSLYKTSTGWGYNVHKTTSSNNLSFVDARLGFFETITTVRGHVVKLYRNESTGAVEKIEANSVEAVRVGDITVFNESTTVDRGRFDLETGRVRPDVNKIIFPSVNFDQTVKVGDIALYWDDAAGWHLKRALPVEGTLAKNKEGKFVIGGTDVRMESNVSRYNLFDADRPTQFFTAYTRMGLTGLSVIAWTTETGNPVGFSYGKGGKAALALAIQNAKAAKEGVVVSVDGSDVAADKKWAPKEALYAFHAAIDAAQKVCNSNLSSMLDYDAAIYKLANEMGAAGNRPSGFIGSLGVGSKAN